MKRNVVLVDSDDNQQGLIDIYQAHANPGVLHRAISVVLVNSNKQILLQKRSEHKPLWPLFWSNTVCTHPFEGEDYLTCAVRRLQEEMGITLDKQELRILYRFEYQADYNEELSEHELDTVLVGRFGGEVKPAILEVAGYQWLEAKELVSQNIGELTPWFKLILEDTRFTTFINSRR